jgi:hypothetical protein
MNALDKRIVGPPFFDIDDDVLAAANELASGQKTTAG